MAELASCFALSAVLESAPRSFSPPASLSVASDRSLLMSPLWLVMPATITTKTPTPSATRPSSSSAAPKPRGTLWTASHADQRRGDRRDHAGGEHRQDDRVRERQDPDGAHQEQEDADEQPRRQSPRSRSQPGAARASVRSGGIRPRRPAPRRSRSASDRTTRRVPSPSAESYSSCVIVPLSSRLFACAICAAPPSAAATDLT